MRTFAIIGYPLAQSFSQKYFTQKFAENNINAQYLQFPIPTIAEFQELLIRHPYITGMNVTIPYKEKVMQFLHELDPIAQEAGAVNCIKITWNGSIPHLKGYNTDLVGFDHSLSPLLKPHHKKALILGTGGASKAVEYVMRKYRIDYRFVSRTPKGVNHIAYSDLTPELMQEYKLIINSTPVGMFPNVDDCPLQQYEGVGADHLFYDLVYNPEKTVFLQKAEEKGAVIKNGMDMLYLQAEEGWRIWNE